MAFLTKTACIFLRKKYTHLFLCNKNFRYKNENKISIPTSGREDFILIFRKRKSSIVKALGYHD